MQHDLDLDAAFALIRELLQFDNEKNPIIKPIFQLESDFHMLMSPGEHDL